MKLRFPDYVTMGQDGGKFVSLTHLPFLPPGDTPGTHFCQRLSRHQGHSAIGMTPSGIEPATFRFVARYLNHCATAVPHLNIYSDKMTVKSRTACRDRQSAKRYSNVLLSPEYARQLPHQTLLTIRWQNDRLRIRLHSMFQMGPRVPKTTRTRNVHDMAI